MAPGGRRSRSWIRVSYAPYILLPPLLLYAGMWILGGRGGGGACGECDVGGVPGRFMWYAPHSGFSNQVSELRNALRVAAILGRILILPPVTDHHALSLGSCPKYRIVEPQQLRAAAAAHISDLVTQSRYYSIADVVNISAVSPKFVKTIDFRVFALLWCGANVQRACHGPLCHELSNRLATERALDECVFTQAAACGGCVSNVDDNCATTVWTYDGSQPSRRVLLESRPAKKLKMKKYDGSHRIKRDIYQSLAGGSEAGKAKLLAFGSLFSGEYQGTETHVDLSAASGDAEFDKMFHVSRYLPLSRVLVEGGQEYVKQKMKTNNFFCTQLRLLDGQFKNHWSKTFGSLKSRLESLQAVGTRAAVAVFVMTDLPQANWTGTYLNELWNNNKFKLFILEERDEIVAATARKMLASELGIKSGIVPQQRREEIPRDDDVSNDIKVADEMLPEILLYLQEAICSIASLGFHGTAGSTISESISQMRNAEAYWV